MATKKKLLQAAAGNAGGEALNVEDVFSTYLYEGNATSRSITNGIDLDGEGGLVWIKNRESGSYNNNFLSDTENGANNFLATNQTNGLRTLSGFGLTAFNSDGFDMGTAYGNESGIDIASWTFRKAEKWFDIQTWTGDGTTGRQISHNLAGEVGTLIIKKTSAAGSWIVYHRSLGTSKYMALESTSQALNFSAVNTVTSTYFVSDNQNASGATYVAYLFAHNDGDGEFGPDGDADIIKCGSYTGNGSEAEIDLGWEPQWLLIKNTTTAAPWIMLDNMRSMSETSQYFLQAQSNSAENTSQTLYPRPTATGFRIPTATNAYVNNNNNTYIYIAIRRGPLAPPESATDVFDVEEATAVEGTDITTNFPVDTQLLFGIGSTYSLSYVLDRLRGVSTNSTSSGYDLEPNNTNSESSATLTRHWGNTGFQVPAFLTNFRTVYYNWKRAPNYMDVVAYTGNGTAGRTVSHNLGVAPEMMWLKIRGTAATSWYIYHKDIGNTNFLNFDNGASAANSGAWNNTTPTDSVFTLGTQYQVNGSGQNIIAYLFASLDGISKVGSVTHSGTTNVDCGFTSGARFVLLKRTDATGDWYVWDSERGIVSGNDPYLLLNSTAAEVTNTDYIDPLSSGFTITSSFTAGDYIFYAVS